MAFLTTISAHFLQPCRYFVKCGNLILPCCGGIVLRLSCEFCRAFGGFAGGRGQNRRRQPYTTIHYHAIHTKLAAEQRSTPTVEARHTCHLDCMHVRYPSKSAYRLALPPPRGNTSLSDHKESAQATNLAAELAAGSQTSSYNFGRAQQGGKRGADAATVVWRECWYSRTSRVKPRSRAAVFLVDYWLGLNIQHRLVDYDTV